MNRITPHWKVSLYIAAVVVTAWLWFWLLKHGLGIREWAAITVLMWIPGLMSILFRLVFKEGFGDVGWRVGKARFWLWAYLGPLVLASLSILLALLLGKASLAPHLQDQTMLDGIFFKLSWPMRDSSTDRHGARILLCLRRGTGLARLSATTTDAVWLAVSTVVQRCCLGHLAFSFHPIDWLRTWGHCFISSHVHIADGFIWSLHRLAAIGIRERVGRNDGTCFVQCICSEFPWSLL
jgi:hypothetical protein